MIFFSEFHWQDLGLLGKIMIFIGFLGNTNCQDVGKKPEKSKILATNEKIQDLILARNSRLGKIIQDLAKKTKMLSTGMEHLGLSTIGSSIISYFLVSGRLFDLYYNFSRFSKL